MGGTEFPPRTYTECKNQVCLCWIYIFNENSSSGLLRNSWILVLWSCVPRQQTWKVWKVLNRHGKFLSYEIKAKNFLWTLCGKGLQKATKGITKCDRMVGCKVITKCNRVDYKERQSVMVYPIPLHSIQKTVHSTPKVHQSDSFLYEKQE